MLNDSLISPNVGESSSVLNVNAAYIAFVKTNNNIKSFPSSISNVDNALFSFKMDIARPPRMFLLVNSSTIIFLTLSLLEYLTINTFNS